MRLRILSMVTILATASLACSINLNLPDVGVRRLQTGPTETVTLAEAAPAGVDVVDLTINMAAGRLALGGGASQLVEGEVRYNVAEWAPTVERSESGVVITQGGGRAGGVPDSQVVNEWTLQLGQVPLNLSLNSGAYDGTLNLGGVPLRRLAISDGASNARVSFDTANPEEMERLTYDTGASSVRLTGLANANFADMAFNGGAGEYVLDFSGDLQRDAAVRVRAGVASVRVVVPANTAARVLVTGSLTDVNTEGAWLRSGDTYETGATGPLLTINVDMGVGSLTLVSQ
jgi:hypothetical protein